MLFRSAAILAAAIVAGTALSSADSRQQYWRRVYGRLLDAEYPRDGLQRLSDPRGVAAAAERVVPLASYHWHVNGSLMAALTLNEQPGHIFLFAGAARVLSLTFGASTTLYPHRGIVSLADVELDLVRFFLGALSDSEPRRRPPPSSPRGCEGGGGML